MEGFKSIDDILDFAIDAEQESAESVRPRTPRA